MSAPFSPSFAEHVGPAALAFVLLAACSGQRETPPRGAPTGTSVAKVTPPAEADPSLSFGRASELGDPRPLLAWSSGGRYLAWSTVLGARVLDTTRHDLRVIEPLAGAGRSLAFRPGTLELAVVTARGITVVDLATGHTRELTASGPGGSETARGPVLQRGPFGLIAFDPSGAALAVIRGSVISELDPSTGRELRRYPALSQEVRTLRFDPRGASLAAVAGGKVHVFDRAALRAVILDGRAGSMLEGPHWDPSSTTLAGSAERESDGLAWIQIWDIASARVVRESKPLHTAPFAIVLRSTDGHRLAAASGSVLISYDDATLVERTCLFEPGRSIDAAAFDPTDARRIATMASAPGGAETSVIVRVLNLDEGRPTQSIPATNNADLAGVCPPEMKPRATTPPGAPDD